MFNRRVDALEWDGAGAPAGRKTEVAIIRVILEIIAGICGFYLTFIMVYNTVLGFFGFKKAKKDYADHDPESRFLILIPAHNEERVIGDIIRNLEDMDYPRELYDYYVIADNCTDQTAEVARQAGARVIETRKETPDAPTGKPIALRKALTALGDYQNRYDLMMIFDADNLMDTNMFREVNSQYLDKDKPDFIQCYLGVKNKKGISAWIDYTSFTVSNRFVALAKHRLHLNCGIGGTGFAMTTSYLYQRGGWTTCSLTEDLEMQTEATLEGRRVLWNHFTRVYDEKPTSLRASIRQKIRWGQGHWYVTIHNTENMFRALFAGRIGVGEFLSVLTYLYSVAATPVVVLHLLVQFSLSLIIPERSFFTPDFDGLIIGAVVFAYTYLFRFYMADWKDNGIAFSLRTIPIMLAGSVANLLVAAFKEIGGLIKFRDQQHWVKTDHAIAAKTVTTKECSPQLRRKVA